MKNKFSGIVFEESFVLGWSLKGRTLVLFLELFLTDIHPDYSPPKQDEFGCYNLGVLRFDFMRGFKEICGNRFPKKNNILGEYIDIYEIESFTIGESKSVISVESFDVEFEFEDVELLLLNNEDFETYIKRTALTPEIGS